MEEGPSWFQCWFTSRLAPILCCSRTKSCLQQGAGMQGHGPMANQGRAEEIITVDSSGPSRVWMMCRVDLTPCRPRCLSKKAAWFLQGSKQRCDAGCFAGFLFKHTLIKPVVLMSRTFLTAHSQS